MGSNKKLYFIQALRIVAAWLVITDHALLEVSRNRVDNSLTHLAWTLGSSGVYVFFVISGFIMVHICWESFGRADAAVNFLRRRLIRIAPLYWLATIAALLYHQVSATHGANAGWTDLIHSFAFIPYAGENGEWAPILPQGWTLSYEMMFYAIFAMGLFFRRWIGLLAVGLTVAASVVVGPLLQNETLAYLTSPIVLYFVLGMGLATLWRGRGCREQKWAVSAGKFLEPLGDASYSIYLAHGLILTILVRAWVLIAGSSSIWIVPVGLVVATFAGWAIHILVEIPTLRLITTFFEPSQKGSTILKLPDAR